jgi:hypothetical protein
MGSRRRISPHAWAFGVIALLGMGPAASGCSGRFAYEMSRLLFSGESRTLRDRPNGAVPNSPERPALLILALDGIDRTLLYDMLRAGDLPALAMLLGAEGKHFPHAYFDETRIATLPSSTIAAWVTAFTGVGPATTASPATSFSSARPPSWRCRSPAR